MSQDTTSVPAVRAERLGKRYGQTWGLRDCTFAVPAGSVAGLVGPNGAGKTTCPFRLKAARGGAADAGFAMWLWTSGRGAVQTYLANSAAGSRPTARWPPVPASSRLRLPANSYASRL